MRGETDFEWVENLLQQGHGRKISARSVRAIHPVGRAVERESLWTLKEGVIRLRLVALEGLLTYLSLSYTAAQPPATHTLAAR